MDSNRRSNWMLPVFIRSFSIRTMLLAVTAFGVWLGWYVNRAERQRKAVEWAEQNGGYVYYAFQMDDNLRLKKDPKWSEHCCRLGSFEK